MSSYIRFITSLFFALFLCFFTAYGQDNEILSMSPRYTATFEHIAVHLSIEGDDNVNSTIAIAYRRKGTMDYLPAAMALRARPDMIVDGSSLNMNFHAGSAMHLLPNTEYELQLAITDPDGGSEVINSIQRTKKFPTKEQANTIIYVVPGTVGGDGSASNPYRGIQAAADNAAPGQIIQVADGTYDSFAISKSGTEDLPIIIKSANLHGAIVDGANTDRGIITIGVFDDSIQYVIIDGLHICNGRWGIDAQNTQYLTIQNNKVVDVDFGMYNRRANGWDHNQYVYNNEWIGRTPWPQTNGEIPSERGIDIRGNSNVVSYNTISDFGDGISTDGSLYKISYAMDIHNNDINRVVDDLIEIDGTISNTRIYRNRGYNGRMGVSVAPVFGGPAYIFRNEFYNLESSSIKMNRSPAGLIIINNSMAKSNRGLISNSGWQNTVVQNNLLLSTHYVFEEYGLVAGSEDEWDHNGYKSTRSGTSGGPWFKWDNVRYNDIAALTASGVTEPNSVSIDTSDFMDITIPTSYATEALPSDQDFSLTSTSLLIDAGIHFDNILTFDEIANSPDIGAYEYGQPLPTYGHDFTSICDPYNLSARTWNGTKSEGWYDPLNWTPCGVPNHATIVTIPGGLDRFPFLNTPASIADLHIIGDGKLQLTNKTLLQIGQ